MRNSVKLEIGQVIKWKNIIWRVVGIDPTNPNNAAYPKWDYLLKENKKEGLQRVTKDEILDSQQILADSH